MSTTFDVGELSRELATLTSHRHLDRVAFVLPLAPGKREIAYELLSEGPPFDMQRAGVDSHEILLTDSEAVFVFGVPDGPATLERILADEDFWTVVHSWERIAGGHPRLAEVAFEWHASPSEPL